MPLDITNLEHAFRVSSRVRALRSIRCVLGLLLCMGACKQCLAQETYFPPKIFGDEMRDEIEASVDAVILSRLEEPSLFERRNSFPETYRFLWLRTSYKPIVVRMQVQKDGSSLLTIKVANGRAGFPKTVTKVIRSTTRSLSREQTEAFRTKVQGEKFWDIPSRDAGGPRATDADGWMLEAVKQGNYHLVFRAVPNQLPETEKAVHALGLMLAIDLGQMNIPENER